MPPVVSVRDSAVCSFPENNMQLQYGRMYNLYIQIVKNW